MSSNEALYEMDPAARAVAEVRAREAGMSLSQWLEALVYEQAAPARRLHFHGGGPPVRTDDPTGWLAFQSGSRQSMHLDVDATYWPLVRYADIEPSNLERRVIGGEIHEAAWSALRVISAFPPRISLAAFLLSAAFAEADVGFRLPPRRSHARWKSTGRWYHTLVDTCLHRSREVRNALVHEWTPSGRAKRLWGDAFHTLCDLTPARHELIVLFHHDRSRASTELAKYLDLATQEFELSANLLAAVDSAPSSEPADDQRFSQLRTRLLERAGGGVTLTQGAELLGVTRQALHKRIKTGTALGMMDGDEIVLPRLQFIGSREGGKLLPGLSKVVPLFTDAGGWSALQFLLDQDPNLGRAPIEALRSNEVERVVDAARAYLGLDEG